MSIIESKVRIKKSRRDVWSVFTDIASWKSWYPNHIEKLEPGWKKGATLVFGGGFDNEIKEFVPEERVVFGRSMRIIWTFRSTSGSETEVSYAKDFSASTLVIDDRKAAQKQSDIELAGLKRFCESGGTVDSRGEAKAKGFFARLFGGRP